MSNIIDRIVSSIIQAVMAKRIYTLIIKYHRSDILATHKLYNICLRFSVVQVHQWMGPSRQRIKISKFISVKSRAARKGTF